MEQNDNMRQMSRPRHNDMVIKVCGLRDLDNMRQVACLTPMLAGFIFYPGSPRYVGEPPADFLSELSPFVNPVAVFVNAEAGHVRDVASRYGFGIVQLHGDESARYCAALKESGLVVFKAIGVTDNMDWDSLKDYEGIVDAFVFDTGDSRRGGTGRKFDWCQLERYRLSTPYLLGGGIGPDDVDEIVAAMRPGMVGIDINSRFETEPGVKDITKLVKFILSLRKFNEDESIAKPFWTKK